LKRKVERQAPKNLPKRKRSKKKRERSTGGPTVRGGKEIGSARAQGGWQALPQKGEISLLGWGKRGYFYASLGEARRSSSVRRKKVFRSPLERPKQVLKSRRSKGKEVATKRSQRDSRDGTILPKKGGKTGGKKRDRGGKASQLKREKR